MQLFFTMFGIWKISKSIFVRSLSYLEQFKTQMWVHHVMGLSSAKYVYSQGGL